MKEKILQELERLHDRKGLLRAEDVVEFARNESSALHSQFEWDDTKAAEEYRKEQARGLIRIAVQMLPDLSRPVRIYASLGSDRLNPGGGYRRTTDILSHEGMRAELLEQALREFQRIRELYKGVKELTEVFSAVDKAAVQYRPKKKQSKQASA